MHTQMMGIQQNDKHFSGGGGHLYTLQDENMGLHHTDIFEKFDFWKPFP